MSARVNEEQLAALLGRYRCFYYHNDEVIGPVSLWIVHELVDSDLLTPDVAVILEGTDFWYSYVEQELRVVPDDKLRPMAAYSTESQFFLYHGGQVTGPQSILAIAYLVRGCRLPNGVQICEVGSEEWKVLELSLAIEDKE